MAPQLNAWHILGAQDTFVPLTSTPVIEIFSGFLWGQADLPASLARFLGPPAR